MREQKIDSRMYFLHLFYPGKRFFQKKTQVCGVLSKFEQLISGSRE